MNTSQLPVIAVLGAGRIGITIAHLLARSNHYQVLLADRSLAYAHKHLSALKLSNLNFIEADLSNELALQKIFSQPFVAVISCLPYFANRLIAKMALLHQRDYFDLTEDVGVAQFIDTLAANTKNIFVPQCGVAPGLINIIAADLLRKFETLDQLELRCGALSQIPYPPLLYALTWSVDGLINEYGNPCEVIMDGKITSVAPLHDLESLTLDHINYEAFNTSGGVGSLVQQCAGRVQQLNYKTIRFPGHCERMRFLMQDLKLNEDRDTLKKILLRVLPTTQEDQVLVAVTAHQGGRHQQIVERFLPAKIDQIHYTAIQLVTATSAIVVMDYLLTHRQDFKGRVFQEQIPFQAILDNRFANYLLTSQLAK